MLSLQQPVSLVALIAVCLLPASCVFSQTATYWQRTSGTGNWNTSSNWTNGAPQAGYVAYFTGSNNGTVSITSNSSADFLVFNTGLTSTTQVNVDFDLSSSGALLDIGNTFIGSARNSNRRASVDMVGDGGSFGDGLFRTSTLNINTGSSLRLWDDVRASVTSNMNLFGSMQVFEDSSLFVGGTMNLGYAEAFAVGGGVTEQGTLLISGSSAATTVQGNVFAGASDSNLSQTYNARGVIDVFAGTLNVTGELRLRGASNSTLTTRGGATLNTGSFFGRGFQTDIVDTTWTNQGDFDGASLINSTLVNNGNLISGDFTNSLVTTDHVDTTRDTDISGGRLDVTNSLRLSENIVSGASAQMTVSGLGKITANSIEIADLLSNSSKSSLMINGINGFGSPTVTAGSADLLGGDLILNSGSLAVAGNLNVGTRSIFSFNGGQATVGSLFLTGGTIDQKSGSLTIDGGTYDIGSATQSHVGSVAGDSFTQSLVNGATMDTGSLTLDVGHSGSGTLNIHSGSIVTSGAGVLARNSGSSGTVSVDGSGSRWENDGVVIVGMREWALATVSNGGTLTSYRGEIGEQGSGVGSVHVDGANSRWDITKVGTAQLTNGNLLIGEFGDGTLLITHGGTVSNLTGAIATQNTSTGVVTVNGAGSTWNNGGSLLVGGSSGGNATLNIENSGLVTVADTLTIGSNGMVNLDGGILEAETVELNSGAEFSMNSGVLNAENFIGNLTQDGGLLAPGDSPGQTSIFGDYRFNAGTIQLEMAGLLRGSEFDAIDITGLADLNGTIELSFINGFTANLGDQFNFIDAASFSGTPTFDFSNAALASGLIWDSSNFSSDGSLFVVSSIPEPGNALLIGSILLGVAMRRRKSDGPAGLTTRF